MREDLIEGLRKLIDDRCGDGPSGPNYDPELLDVLTEAAAALEAAREDAERYRWLRDPCSGAERVIFYCRGDYGRGLMSSAVLDAAIDQARGKGGGEVEGG